MIAVHVAGTSKHVATGFEKLEMCLSCALTVSGVFYPVRRETFLSKPSDVSCFTFLAPATAS